MTWRGLGVFSVVALLVWGGLITYFMEKERVDYRESREDIEIEYSFSDDYEQRREARETGEDRIGEGPIENTGVVTEDGIRRGEIERDFRKHQKPVGEMEDGLLYGEGVSIDYLLEYIE